MATAATPCFAAIDARIQHTDGLNADTGCDLVVGAHRELREPLLPQAPQVAPHAGGAEHHRAAAVGQRVLDLLGADVDERVRADRVHREELAVGRLHERLGDLLLERRVERDRPQRALGVQVRGDDRAAERLAGVLGEHRRRRA